MTAEKTAEDRKITVRRVLLLLVIAPALLAVLIFACSFVLDLRVQSGAGVPSQGIVRLLPYILLTTYTLLFLILLRFLRADNLSLGRIGWDLAAVNRVWWAELAIGVALGVALLAFRNLILLPVAQWVLEPSGGYQFQPFVLRLDRATLLIPRMFGAVVEECVYRGYAIGGLRPRVGAAGAVVISTLFFVALHWWLGYLGMFNALFLGALLAAVFLWRRNLVATSAAHVVANALAVLT